MIPAALMIIQEKRGSGSTMSPLPTKASTNFSPAAILSSRLAMIVGKKLLKALVKKVSTKKLILALCKAPPSSVLVFNK